MSIRIVIVDDQALVRSGLSMILDHQSDIEVVAECANGVEAIEAAKKYIPDLILMDIRMPEMDGLSATSAILGDLNIQTRIVILSTFDLDEYIYRALREGASGFILKDTPPDELISAVHVVAQGGALLTPSITKKLIGAFVELKPSHTNLTGHIERLTTREKEILKNLALGFNNSEIASRLFIGESTVKTHVSSLLSKLELRDRAQAVIFAYENGVIRVGSHNQVNE